jgi:hypothetical protein
VPINDRRVDADEQRRTIVEAIERHGWRVALIVVTETIAVNRCGRRLRVVAYMGEYDAEVSRFVSSCLDYGPNR